MPGRFTLAVAPPAKSILILKPDTEPVRSERVEPATLLLLASLLLLEPLVDLDRVSTRLEPAVMRLSPFPAAPALTLILGGVAEVLARVNRVLALVTAAVVDRLVLPLRVLGGARSIMLVSDSYPPPTPFLRLLSSVLLPGLGVFGLALALALPLVPVRNFNPLVVIVVAVGAKLLRLPALPFLPLLFFVLVVLLLALVPLPSFVPSPASGYSIASSSPL